MTSARPSSLPPIRKPRFFRHVCVTVAIAAIVAAPSRAAEPVVVDPNTVVLIGLGDSLTHGTMDATNNWLNSSRAFLQRVASSLSTQVPIHFVQPYYDVNENRLQPTRVPTNLGVDGADSFSVQGIEYGPRVGSAQNTLSLGLLAEQPQASLLSDDYDKVIFPINALAQRPLSAFGAANFLLQHGAPAAGISKGLISLWIGNNDSSTAALGTGGSNPQFFPLPLDQIAADIKPELRIILNLARGLGLASFEPYAQASIERNLTTVADFDLQFNRLLDHLALATGQSSVQTKVLVLTLPYYSAIGYLMDSEDLEYYLRKLDPSYSVPASFARVAPDGEPIVDFLRGDRVSLLTFGLMYALLSTGHTAAEVNEVLAQDGLVLAEAEAQFIMARVDAFNQIIRDAAAARGARFHLIDVGQYLNDTLAGDQAITVNGQRLTRKWIRGGGFSFDGVHPSYVGHSIIANFILAEINSALGLNAPLYDLAPIHQSDPYVDHDGDGWAAGPAYMAPGINQLLFLFKDPSDTDASLGVTLAPNVWDVISDILLADILGNPQIRQAARARGLAGVR